MSREIEAIKARLKAATAGPWHTTPTRTGRLIIDVDTLLADNSFGVSSPNIKSHYGLIHGGILFKADADLIANAPTDLRYLLDTLETAEGECARLREALEFYANPNHWMARTENGDCDRLTAHGEHFDGTDNGYVEACEALKGAETE